MNELKKYFQELLYLVGKDKRKLPFFVLLFLFSSLLDVVGLGLIVSYIQLIVSPENINEGYIYDIQEFFGVHQPPNEILTTLGASLLLVFLIKAVFGIYVENKLIIFAELQRSLLQSKLMWAYQHISFLDFLSKNTSYYINLINTSTYYHGSAVRTALKLLSNSIITIAVLIMLMLNSPIVSLLIILFLGTLVVSYSYFLKNRIIEGSQLNQKYSENMIKAINEGMHGYKEIRILGKETFFHDKVKENSNNVARVQGNYQTLIMVPRYLLEFIIITALVISVLVSIKFGSDLQLLAPTIALFGVAAIRLLPMMNFYSEGINRLRYSRHYVSLLYNDVSKLKRYKTIKEKESTENSDLFMHITLKNTSLIYPGTQHHAIDDISMTIKAGEAIGIIGASGSGKTTLINTILGLIEPQSGNILYNNLPLNNNIHKWHKHVAYLPQDSFITDDSVRHNVALGIEDSKIDDSHVYQSLRKASLDDLIEQLPDDINTILGENGMRLSGGQRQRIVLARAFYHNRDVLIMDESTSALDNATEREVVNEIQKLKGSITLIVIAHRMSTIEHCDRIYLLDNGKIIDQGNYKHIVRDKTLNNG